MIGFSQRSHVARHLSAKLFYLGVFTFHSLHLSNELEQRSVLKERGFTVTLEMLAGARKPGSHVFYVSL